MWLSFDSRSRIDPRRGGVIAPKQRCCVLPVIFLFKGKIFDRIEDQDEDVKVRRVAMCVVMKDLTKVFKIRDFIVRCEV